VGSRLCIPPSSSKASLRPLLFLRDRSERGSFGPPTHRPAISGPVPDSPALPLRFAKHHPRSARPPHCALPVGTDCAVCVGVRSGARKRRLRRLFSFHGAVPISD